ncbi:cell wall anchor protein [Corynebacterium anserum]|uniref:Cell wall anchor protein n=1 Tax=Corynebacterium anserum TaxID=2684406 RepID=A0A7G7YQT5_9CORY|nr:cell wall anchor protein [Corynebacterium anserum]MBC2681289.1 cell wall anchor protein [Corynebacterium anserum]QNH96855.1 cell wall anchor protein [Corynebacterium anserum]
MTENKEVGHRSHMAGAFDIRNVIGALMGLYGVVLLISYLFLDPGQSWEGLPKQASYNLWAGIAMVVVAAVFFIWSKLAPVKIDED